VNLGPEARRDKRHQAEPDESQPQQDRRRADPGENGFTDGNIISGGKVVLDLGGGLSRPSAPPLQRGVLRRPEDVEHKANALISPIHGGREATVLGFGRPEASRSVTGFLVQTIFTPATTGSQGNATVKI